MAMSKSHKIVLGIILVALMAFVAIFAQRDAIKAWLFAPTKSKVEQGITGQNRSVTMVKNLTVPWEVAFLPNGDMLVTERPGNLLRISNSSQKFTVKGVEHTSEGGLLGLAVHPKFTDNQWIYLYYTTRSMGQLVNVVERFTLAKDTVANSQIILKDIPAADNHDGGRLAFGPDGKLYITTGDAGDEKLAQDTQSLAGKILRVNDDGSVPENNPFKNLVYSYGLRNVQGIAWDNKERLWAVDHGRSGVRSGFDELNLIKPGANYGWPVIEGDQTRAGMVTPVAHSGAGDTWAPAGLAYSDGSLFFTGLRGQALYEAKIQNDRVTLRGHFREEYGRLRAVTVRNNALYLTTSNTDGRGMPHVEDDKILRISREALNR